MSNKLKIFYEIHPLDEKARPAIENTLKSLMDWVQISENEWLVLSNRLNANKLQTELTKHFKTKQSKISVVALKKKTKVENPGYINAKNDELSEILFTTRF